MIELGFPLGAGTDATVVSSINPWTSLWWLVSGQAPTAVRAAPPSTALTRAQALALYTRGSAWFSARGARARQPRGRARSPTSPCSRTTTSRVAEDAIPALRSELTLVGGRVVHAGGAVRRR